MILDGKIVVVTGGLGLIGKELVADIGRKGGTAINADIGVATSLRDRTLELDITNDDSVQSGIDRIVKEYGRIDGWVNNAYPRTKDWGTKFEEINPDSWRANVNMQLNSYFVCSQKALKVMASKSKGRWSTSRPSTALSVTTLACMRSMEAPRRRLIRPLREAGEFYPLPGFLLWP